MAQKRRTLVTELGRAHGYRTVAVMPGLQSTGPKAPSTDSIASTTRSSCTTRDRASVVADPRPVALRSSNTSSWRPRNRRPGVCVPADDQHAHAVQPDAAVSAVVGAHAHAAAVRRGGYQKAWAEPPDWLNLGPSYVHSMDYALATLGGFVGLPRTRDVVLVLIGDHQPPAVVSGEGAPWDVPVHVVSSRGAFLDALVAHGFTRGVHPRARR
jgi:hypothetical protein